MHSVPPKPSWTTQQLNSYQLTRFDPQLVWLDSRTPDEFVRSRFANAFRWRLPNSSNCLNQLPSRATPLALLASADEVLVQQAWLAEKGYQVVGWMDSDDFARLDPGLWPCVTGIQEQRLWQANPHLLEAISSAADGLNQDHVFALDLGCGGGREAVKLASLGWQVVAVDNQPSPLGCALDLAREEQVEVDFRLADLTDSAQRPTESFDLIYQLRFLERGLFDYIDRQLNPGGYVFIETFFEGVQAFGSPKNPRFILQPNELTQAFAHFEIIVDKLSTLPDGRPINRFFARKPIESIKE